MYTQKGRKFRAVSLRLDALDGKQCRESWRENFFFLSFFFFFFFLEYDYCHGVAHLERYSIILQIARNDTLWRGPQELGAQRVIDKRERAARVRKAIASLSMDSCRVFCLVNVIIRGQIEVASVFIIGR